MTELDIILKVIETLSKDAKCKVRYASELDNFLTRQRQVKSNKYRLGVIGVTSSGKSTMINSLLGECLLPAVARPSSSQLVSCYHSSKRIATIYFQDGKTKQFSGGTLNQKLLEKYGDEGINSKNRENVKQIELSTPEFPFDENIILIDSPGLDAYGYAGHEQLTMNSLLPTIDFCIFVTTCKTNSDDKMLSVLNTIAEYEKPVIIVQNMIDSLKPSLDGKKSVSDVAQDHRVRLERIINSSNIKDKSKVHIVQISSIYALKARQNKLRTNVDRKLLEQSNYTKLISVVNAAFNQVRPIVEGHRMLFLKKEITRIAKAAKEDGAGVHGLVSRFEYEDTEKEYNSKKQNCINAINEAINNIASRLSTVKNRNYFTETDITNIKGDVSKCEQAICGQMKVLNELIVSVCEKLNIDSRNIITDFRFDKPELRLKKRKEVVKDGYWKTGEEHFTLNPFKMNNGFFSHKDKDVWIDTSYTKEVIDVNGSIKNAIDYINSSTKVFSQTIQRWQKSIEVTEGHLYSEIGNRRSEYEARINQALDCQAYQDIGIELSKIADSIKTINENQTKVNSTRTDIKKSELFTLRVRKELLPMYKLSESLRIKIQYDTVRFFVGKKNINLIIGWDDLCEAKYLRYAFNQESKPNTFAQGTNILGNSIHLIHKPNSSIQYNNVSGKGIHILVNATQIGAALNEISRIQVTKSLKNNDNLYFVIQDFNEIMNGDSVSETLDNIITMKQKLSLNNVRLKYMLIHDNPIFNLAAVEAQATGCTTHSDEIKIMNDLQKKFYFLLPPDRLKRNIFETTIRTIIHKLGKV